MKFSLIIALSFLQLLAFGNPDQENDFVYFDEKTRVEIDFSVPEYYANNPKHNVQMVDADKRTAIVEKIRMAVAKYPLELIHNNLYVVYVWKTVDLNGTDIGAMHNAKYGIIYINFDEELFLLNALKDLEASLHHEFNHILVKNNQGSFAKKQWADLNDEDFEYSELSDYVIGSEEFKQIYHEVGFLHARSQTSVDEDLASFAENMFLSGNADFWFRVGSNTRLRPKLRLTIEFYQHLHPSLDINFFKNLQ